MIMIMTKGSWGKMRKVTFFKRSFAAGLALCMAIASNGVTSRAAVLDKNNDITDVISSEVSGITEYATPLDGEYYYDSGEEVDSSADMAMELNAKDNGTNRLSASYSYGKVVIDATKFPDANLRAAIIASAKAQKILVSNNEVENVFSITLTISNTTINSFKGLENLNVRDIEIENSVINCNFDNITSLDSFTATSSKFSTLNLTKSASLFNVKLNNITGLKSINLSNCKNLFYLRCNNNKSLTNIDVSGCEELRTLTFNDSPISSLSMKGTYNLGTLHLVNTTFNTVDLSAFPKLTQLNVDGSGFSSLDVSKLPELEILSCNSNSLTELNLQNNKKLTKLYCTSNSLTKLDLRGLKDIERIECESNSLSELLLDSDNQIQYLYCQKNALKKLDLGSNTVLRQLYINDNKISNISLKKLSELRGFSCGRNNLSSIDVSSCPLLIELYCGGNKLTKLDLSNNPKLEYFKCKDNRFPYLDLTKNLNLRRTSCEVSPQKTWAYLFGSDDKLNMSLVKGMDPKLVSNVSGATKSGNYLNLNSTGKANKQVKYTYQCDPYFSMNVTVVGFGVEITKVSLDKTTAKMNVNDTLALNATLSPGDAADKSLSWTSSNTKVATVNSKGVVTAVGSGKATITAKSWNGVKGTCTVTATVPDVSVYYKSHVQSFGWEKDYKANGAMSGTSGMAKRLEAMKIYVKGNNNLGIQYVTHCQTYGWLTWSANNEVNGTSGEAKRLEAIKIQLTGRDKNLYDVYYRVHAQTYGWLNWAKNGEPSGTAGYVKRLEGIQVVIVKKGTNINKNLGGITSKNSKAYINKDGKAVTVTGSDNVHVQYQSHVQTYGWQIWKNDGNLSGTSGQSKRLEAVRIKLSNNTYGGGITYQTHVQTYGWQSWKSNGELAGTSGQSKRLEAIRIKLTGKMAEKYDVYYCAHAQKFGWLGWAKNGQSAGTEGFGYRLEAIRIVLVPKGGKAPGATNGAFRKK